MFKSFDDFVEYYLKYGKCPNQLSKPNHTLNEKELLSKWKSYSKAKVKNSQKVQKGVVGDPLWDEVSSIVWSRDEGQCRFLSKLKIDKCEDYKYIINVAPFNLIKTLDLAHVIPRSKSSNLYYNSDNIVLLSRYVHSSLDTYHDPITGKSITKHRVEQWWKYIVGEEQYEKLKENI